MKTTSAAIIAFAFAATLSTAHAVPIVNPSFEDDPANFNEFYFGDPNGWSLIDPGGIIDPGFGLDTRGTLDVSFPPANYFPGAAIDGTRVALLFIGTEVNTTEVGLGQVLGTNLAANTHYNLMVDVGNINSGVAANGTFFDLRGFPGFRIELLAGGALLASAAGGIDAVTPDGTVIAEGAFETVSVEFTTGAAHAQLGAPLEIRLFNPNVSDPAIVPLPGFDNVDLEVDFDNVRLEATALVPEPATAWLLAAGLGGLLALRRARPAVTAAPFVRGRG